MHMTTIAPVGHRKTVAAMPRLKVAAASRRPGSLRRGRKAIVDNFLVEVLGGILGRFFGAVFGDPPALASWGTSLTKAPNGKMGKRKRALFCSFWRGLTGFCGIWIGVLARLSSRPCQPFFSAIFPRRWHAVCDRWFHRRDAEIAERGGGVQSAEFGVRNELRSRRAGRPKAWDNPAWGDAPGPAGEKRLYSFCIAPPWRGGRRIDFVAPLQGFRTKYNNVLLWMPMTQGVALGYIISGLRPERRCRVQACCPDSSAFSDLGIAQGTGSTAPTPLGSLSLLQ